MSDKRFVITKNQYIKLKEIFDNNEDIDHVIWEENNSNGIGPVVTLTFSKRIDITDVESW